MFRLAHLSDLHLGPLPPVALRALAGKRLLGWLSWRTGRERTHRPEVLDALVRDLHAARPDHVVITGDLVNLALPEEFALAAAWLEALGPPAWVSVVPGNHDALVALDRRQALDRWAAYMASDDGLGDDAAPFPWLRRRGPLAIIGLSTAVATPPGLATGRLGEAQLEALEATLAGLADDPACRVVLLHHPPLDGACVRRKRLVDAAELRGVLATHGADLVLHGHVHALVRGTLPARAGPIQVFGAPSASSLDPRPEASAQYQIYGIERAGAGWRIAIETRRYRPATATFAPAETHLAEPVGA
jgi:3',5'-cyclic AMP phosphodiesterase CpdA